MAFLATRLPPIQTRWPSPHRHLKCTMLNLTSRGKSHTCDGTTRRDFLQIGTLGSMLGLPAYLAAADRGGVDPHKDKRSCIMIFNLGAPSQLDTFDMKPNAPSEIRGPFKPISTKGDFQLSEILPKHAEIADKFSIVRSCYHTAAAVHDACLLYTSPSPRDKRQSRMPSSA